MKIFGKQHITFVVRDLEKSLKFYAKILALKELSRETKEGPAIDKIVGIPDVKIGSVRLQIPDGTILELLQFYSHPDQSWQKNYPSNHHGCSHIALTVDDIDELYSILNKKDIICKSEPQVVYDGKQKVMYCHDADGIIIEFIQELDFFNF